MPETFDSDPRASVPGEPRIAMDAGAPDPGGPTPIIRARDLAKHFGPVDAVRGLSFAISAGSCVGLLGPNGAGKTTTMRMIMGLTRPTGGDLTVFGQPAQALDRQERARIGLVPQENTLDPELSVGRNLELYGRYYGLPPKRIAERVRELLTFMQLDAKVDARVNQLSGGMKRRLVIARALIADPDLVILDEPTTGLDPQARVLIWRRLQALKEAGKTLLLTTHYMDEAERLCDRIILIDHGRILDEDTPQRLVARHVMGHVLEVQKPLAEGFDLSAVVHEDLGRSVLLFTADVDVLVRQLGDRASFTHRVATLEDVFLRLTGRQLREG
jgi:lipooligosaccharide transport system ATP-binding protein